MRRVCEAQVRQEEGAEGPWRDFFRLGDQGVVVDPAKDLSQPFDAGSRCVLAAEDVVLARHVGSLGVTLMPDLGVCERRSSGRKIASAVPSELSIVPSA